MKFMKRAIESFFSNFILNDHGYYSIDLMTVLTRSFETKREQVFQKKTHAVIDVLLLSQTSLWLLNLKTRYSTSSHTTFYYMLISTEN